MIVRRNWKRDRARFMVTAWKVVAASKTAAGSNPAASANL